MICDDLVPLLLCALQLPLKFGDDITELLPLLCRLPAVLLQDIHQSLDKQQREHYEDTNQ